MFNEHQSRRVIYPNIHSHILVTWGVRAFGPLSKDSEALLRREKLCFSCNTRVNAHIYMISDSHEVSCARRRSATRLLWCKSSASKVHAELKAALLNSAPRSKCFFSRWLHIPMVESLQRAGPTAAACTGNLEMRGKDVIVFDPKMDQSQDFRTTAGTSQ